jgi:hypothetical protein
MGAYRFLFPFPGGAIEVPAAGHHLGELSLQATTAVEDKPGAYLGLIPKPTAPGCPTFSKAGSATEAMATESPTR